MGQVQFWQVQWAQELPEHDAHWHSAWLHVGQLQSEQLHTAHESEQCSHLQSVHSS
ncbi:hypothetical protein GCM10012275_61830 [Longimycelium tulufanense]|uniref:Uncharacterized protein n=1 Tax=Longimycelium tulufanense TaxID=907463 RepID=A0A8J3CKL5_9PSEU|nr:hypothetical protein GCM10012275_61830 [Longimycelium tulufanense]